MTESTSPPTSDELRHREVVLEVPIDAQLDHVWECFVQRTADWWPAEFCAGGPDAKAFHIEPRVAARRSMLRSLTPRTPWSGTKLKTACMRKRRSSAGACTNSG